MTRNQGSTRRFRDHGVQPDGRDVFGSVYVQRIIVDRQIAELVAEASGDRMVRSAAARPSIGHRVGRAVRDLARGAARPGAAPAGPHADAPGRPACLGPSSTP